MDYYMEQIDKHNADGIDFVPIMIYVGEPIPVIASYTKEEFVNEKHIPKTNYLFWKMIDGKKVYVD